MKILITGATGYIGGAAARALGRAGHEVTGLARSPQAADRLRHAGFGAVRGDFADPAGLASAIAGFDAVVSTASVGSKAGDPDSFAHDRVAVRAMLAALAGSGKTLMFTSGSAVFGVFAGGGASATVFAEDHPLPLAEALFAPAAAEVHPMIAAGFGAAMKARVQTEHDVLQANGVRGLVIRPGLVYGHGGSYDLPQMISAARRLGAVPQHGAGHARQGYVHIDDLGELYRLALEHAAAGDRLHGVTGEISLGELARAIAKLLGLGVQPLSLAQMFHELGPVGVSMSLNKRLASQTTRRVTGWAPQRSDILDDIGAGSYAA